MAKESMDHLDGALRGEAASQQPEEGRERAEQLVVATAAAVEDLENAIEGGALPIDSVASDVSLSDEKSSLSLVEEEEEEEESTEVLASEGAAPAPAGNIEIAQADVGEPIQLAQASSGDAAGGGAAAASGGGGSSVTTYVLGGLAVVGGATALVAAADSDDGDGGGGSAAVNTDPVATSDSVTTDEDNAVTISVLDNDSDEDGDQLTVTLETQASNGTAVVNSDGTVTYTPDANFSGNDSFTYSVSDGNGGSDTANVNITVNSVNDAPVANAQTVATDEDVAAVITPDAMDVDG
ncbi:MAG: cadherin-like domain-containing protein, partial [Algiphilus sp.]|uniref:cadherin-like domain-containing protein n=1 Tax=Algiphilus sp. TaxID=1872431 RepID=UPI0025BBDAAA